MVEHVRRCAEHGVQRGGSSPEVGNQGFYVAGRGQRPGRRDRGGEGRGAAVFKIIAVHRGDHDILEFEGPDRLGDTRRLGLIHRSRTSVFDVAVGAGSRAHPAQNHEGRGAVMPAFADVRAVGLFTHRMKGLLGHQALESPISLASRRPHLQPTRLSTGGPGIRPHASPAEERRRYGAWRLSGARNGHDRMLASRP